MVKLSKKEKLLLLLKELGSNIETILLDSSSRASLLKNLGEFSSKNVLAFIKPLNEQNIITIFKICSMPGDVILIYTYSSGKNWGLGSFIPTDSDCIILDLSLMNKIINIDLKRGLAVIEPGVTQGQLSNVLEDTPYMLNVTSSSYSTSILGNILDRGIGYHRQKDEDLMGARILLSTGKSIKLGGHWPFREDKTFYYIKGVGLNILPLVFQSNLGVITQAVISLLPRPSKIAVLKITFSESNLSSSIDFLNQMYRENIITSIARIYNSNAARTYFSTNYAVQEKSFYGFICIQGTKELCNAKLKYFIKALSQYNYPLDYTFVKEKDLKTSDILEKTAYSCFYGLPIYNDEMINLSFNVSSCNLDQHSLDGWISFLPIVPFDAESITKAFTIINCINNTNIRILTTMNIISKSAVDMVIALRFNRNPQDISEVQQVLNSLYTNFIKEGFYPYRLDIDHRDFIVKNSSNKAFIDIVYNIQKVFDPARIFSTRYI